MRTGRSATIGRSIGTAQWRVCRTRRVGASPWADPAAWQIVTHAEEVIGHPLGPVLLDASAEDLAHTDVGQLSVLLVSLMAFRAIADALITETVTAWRGTHSARTRRCSRPPCP